MKLRKARTILLEFPIIVNYLAGGVYKNLYDRFKTKLPQVLFSVLEKDKDFVNYIEKAVDYILVKDLSKLSNALTTNDPKEKYYVNYYAYQPKINRMGKKGLVAYPTDMNWMEVPPNTYLLDFISHVQKSVEASNFLFRLDSIVKKISRAKKDVTFAFEIFKYVQYTQLASSTVIDEEIILD